MKIDKNERDAAILDIVYNGGYPITQIVSKEYLDSTDTFTESTKQFINKYGHVAITLKGNRDLTLRTLQEIMAGTTPPEGTELFCVVTENDNYRKPDNMTLDEHFELLLKEPHKNLKGDKQVLMSKIPALFMLLDTTMKTLSLSNTASHITIQTSGTRNKQELQDELEYLMIGKFCLSHQCLKENK